MRNMSADCNNSFTQINYTEKWFFFSLEYNLFFFKIYIIMTPKISAIHT